MIIAPSLLAANFGWLAKETMRADRAKAEWVIEAPEGAELGIEARHQRAGTIRQVVSLG